MDTQLKKIRINNNTSQEKLAEVAGVSVRTLSRYENGKQIPPLDAALRIAKYYKMLVEEVFDERDYEDA